MCVALVLAGCVGLFGRGYWTPDEPREADIAWRMSFQPDKAVPLLAGEAFCEKPPLTYWVSGAAIGRFGAAAWAARLPNLLYGLITALGVGWLARRSAGAWAGWIAAAAISTFLLSYQVTIWLASDAPLLAATAVALLGAYAGFYADSSGRRLGAYTLMHGALALGFLSKSAAAWMVPALTLLTLVLWERRWRELWRFELYAGLLLQAAVILTWVWFVYAAPDGMAHLKVFFWNNLVGRFAHVDAPQALQYAAAHRNTPGKYLIESPVYLWPWTLLVIAALRRAWRARRAPSDALRPVRFALASSVPAIALLSVAATARNIYVAPALPGLALLLGWWGREILVSADRWDLTALRATAALELAAIGVFGAALTLTGIDQWAMLDAHAAFLGISLLGLALAAVLAVQALRAARPDSLPRALVLLLLGYCTLLIGPAAQLYRAVDAWQDLKRIGGEIRSDAAGRPLVLLAPDETTRALIDLYASPVVRLVEGPIDAAALARLRATLALAPGALVVVQLPGRDLSPFFARLAERAGRVPDATPTASPEWAIAAGLRLAHRYGLPNGRRYALLEAAP